MKRLKFLLGLAVAACAANAASYECMSFVTSDTNTTVMAVNSLTMVVEDGNLVATNSSEVKSFPLESLTRMFFSDSSGIDSLTADDITDQAVTVYNLDGQGIGEYASLQSALSELPAGIYVFKSSNGKSVKIAVK